MRGRAESKLRAPRLGEGCRLSRREVLLQTDRQRGYRRAYLEAILRELLRVHLLAAAAAPRDTRHKTRTTRTARRPRRKCTRTAMTPALLSSASTGCPLLFHVEANCRTDASDARSSSAQSSCPASHPEASTMSAAAASALPGLRHASVIAHPRRASSSACGEVSCPPLPQCGGGGGGGAHTREDGLRCVWSPCVCCAVQWVRSTRLAGRLPSTWAAETPHLRPPCRCPYCFR